MTTHNNAFIINKTWAGLFTAVLGSAIIGGFGFAFTVNADQAVMQSDVQELKEANMPNRLSTMEQQIKQLQKDVDKVDTTTTRIDLKIDSLIQGDINERNERRDHDR